MNSLIFKAKSFSSWNNTYKSKGKIIYPKNIKEIKYICKYLKKKKTSLFNQNRAMFV